MEFIPVSENFYCLIKTHFCAKSLARHFAESLYYTA